MEIVLKCEKDLEDACVLCGCIRRFITTVNSFEDYKSKEEKNFAVAYALLGIKTRLGRLFNSIRSPLDDPLYKSICDVLSDLESGKLTSTDEKIWILVTDRLWQLYSSLQSMRINGLASYMLSEPQPEVQSAYRYVKINIRYIMHQLIEEWAVVITQGRDEFVNFMCNVLNGKMYEAYELTPDIVRTMVTNVLNEYSRTPIEQMETIV